MANRQRGHWELLPILLGVVAIVLVVVVIAQVASPVPGIGGTPVSQETQPAYGTPTNETDVKYKLATEEAAFNADLLLTPSPGPGTEKPPLGVTDDPGMNISAQRPAGDGTIITGFSTFPGSAYHLTADQWSEEKNGVVLIVYAGAKRDESDWNNSQHSLIIVRDASPTNQVHMYEPITPSGLLFIVDAVDERLILRTQDGATLYFDVPSRQFVDTLSVTVTPAPITETPIAPSSTPPPSAYPIPSEVPATTQATVSQS